MGRPRSIFPDEPTLWDLAYLGCSNREVAAAVGCHPSLFSKRPDLASVLSFARADRSAAITRLWNTHPSGALRAEDRAGCLTELVAAAERRSIQRHRPEGLSVLSCQLSEKTPPTTDNRQPTTSFTASTEESTESDGQ